MEGYDVPLSLPSLWLLVPVEVYLMYIYSASGHV